MSGLVYDEDAHKYTLDGVSLPSVTTILSPFSGLEYVARSKLESAASMGTKVHLAMHYHFTGELDYSSIDEAMHEWILAWESFLSDSNMSVLVSEKQVYSKSFRYAGTLDNILIHNKTKKKYICDIKTGLVPKTAGCQTEAYRKALLECEGIKTEEERYCVQIHPGMYKLTTFKEADEDWGLFKSALLLHRRFK